MQPPSILGVLYLHTQQMGNWFKAWGKVRRGRELAATPIENWI